MVGLYFSCIYLFIFKRMNRVDGPLSELICLLVVELLGLGEDLHC